MELWFTEKHSPNIGLTLKIKRCIFHKKTSCQQLDILESLDYGKILLLDGLVMITERDEFVYHEMITHVPITAHPDPKSILIIGGGDGGTVRECLKHAGLERIDLVEIDGEVIDACKKFFPEVSQGLNDPKVKIRVEDGIKFIKGQHKNYDIIIIDSTDPIGPAVGLFEKTFYQDVFNALNTDGIVVTQSGSPFQSTETWLNIFKNLSSIFPKTSSYLAFIPTYPSGLWSFVLASKTAHPIKDMRYDYARQLGARTKYYNHAIHKSAFSLPNFLSTQLTSNGQTYIDHLHE
ncbi:polyamine aminopropyltransferase [bacterium]|nr:polyamine aminopropyltransferase [bacterium]